MSQPIPTASMARDAHDREDLLRDATSYVSRVQLVVEFRSGPSEVFVGFHSSGAVSFYFDQDPVYHFNPSAELRRAFVEDLLVKSETGRLVEMRRQRTDDEVAMVRHKLSDSEQMEFCSRAERKLQELSDALANKRFDVSGSVLADPSEDIIARIANYLVRSDSIRIASSPRVTR